MTFEAFTTKTGGRGRSDKQTFSRQRENTRTTESTEAKVSDWLD